MKREREGGGGERERERERRGESGGGQMGKVGGRGNTGTSHELNRTANSSTREGEEGGAGRDGGREGEGVVVEGAGWEGRVRGGGQIAFTLRYAHIHTQKKRDTSCISSQSCVCRAMPCPLFLSSLVFNIQNHVSRLPSPPGTVFICQGVSLPLG